MLRSLDPSAAAAGSDQMQYLDNLSVEVLENRPAEGLMIKSRRNCVLTRSSLVVTYRGVERACLFDVLPFRRRLEMQLVGLGSLVRNHLSLLSNDKELFHVFNIWGRGYHHWLTEVAPKLFIFDDIIKHGRFLLPEYAPAFVFEFLKHFGFENYLQVKGNTFIRKLNVVSNPNSGHYNAAHIMPVRDRSLALFGERRNRGERHVYVTRRNSRGRTVVNDDEVSNFLVGHGFEILDLDGMKFSEQVRIFSTCRMLISIHGAALTNMIFMPRGSRVVELYPMGFSKGDYFNACYRRLSSILDIQHEYVFCPRKDETAPFDLHWADLVVDVESLGRSLFR